MIDIYLQVDTTSPDIYDLILLELDFSSSQKYFFSIDQNTIIWFKNNICLD